MILFQELTPTPVRAHLPRCDNHVSYLHLAHSVEEAKVSHVHPGTLCPPSVLTIAGVVRLDVLAQPSDTLSITLSHDHTAHENLNRSDALERYLALASCLV
jgi:hypothetical protein